MDVKQVGLIGTGGMGGMLALLFAELGISVHFYDPSDANTKKVLDNARKIKLDDKVKRHDDHASLCKALPPPRAFLFSLPHGQVIDSTVDALLPHLNPGDVLMDASNEHYTATERRQGSLSKHDIHYVGMGVSGGYQSARHGPSISPGGTKQALETAYPLLEKICARDVNGKPCLAKLGPGGAGHYTKMVHNGIEQGLMGALCEVWGIMRWGLDMSLPEIGDVFEKWNSEGPLKDNFLIDIGADICRTKDDKGEFVIDTIMDKVVQDVDEAEGTGVWTVEEAARLHIPIPTIAAAHMFRLGSAHAARRKAAAAAFGHPDNSKDKVIDAVWDGDKQTAVTDLHRALHAAFLLSFIQGLHLLAAASDEKKWDLKFDEILQLWRAGCIIRSDALNDLFKDVYKNSKTDPHNLLANEAVASALQDTNVGLRRVVVRSTEADLPVPSISASLEYFKFMTSTLLPTRFMEAELDYFGMHMYDEVSEGPGEPKTGKHHYEWKPARGRREQEELAHRGKK
ncbi:6-phosphogluconate dehydrogenase [Xylariaceae sp. FL1019]|nr:6-phosphogluconate dehydrogenase [Xylariaceae sp. FL1019]